MQNIEIEKAIPWNPWHGCKKVSPGCKNFKRTAKNEITIRKVQYVP